MLTNSPIASSIFTQNFDVRNRCPIIQIQIGNWYGPVLIDTGSTTTFVPSTLLSQIGTIAIPCVDNEAESIVGSLKFDALTYVTIEILGNVFLNYPLSVANNAVVLNRSNFNAIIGSDLLHFLKTLVINWNHGRISSQDPFTPVDPFHQVRRYHLIEDVSSEFISPDFRSPIQSRAEMPSSEFGTPEIWQHVRQMHNL